MKKIMIMLLISVLMLMSLAACRKNEQAAEGAQTEEGSEMKEEETFDGLEDKGEYSIEVEEDEESGFAPN